MRTRDLSAIGAAAALTLGGVACGQDEVPTESQQETEDQQELEGTHPQPFERNISPSALPPEVQPEERGGPGRANVGQGEHDIGREQYTGTLEVDDQTSDGTTVTVTTVGIEGTDGWLAILDEEDGRPAEPLATVRLTDGTEGGPETGLQVALDAPLDAGEHELWARVHIEAGAIGMYEWPGPDEPLTVDGRIVQAPLEVTVR